MNTNYNGFYNTNEKNTDDIKSLLGFNTDAPKGPVKMSDLKTSNAEKETDRYLYHGAFSLFPIEITSTKSKNIISRQHIKSKSYKIMI